MGNPYAIITASDAKYGGFLINHWLKSLKANVHLADTDIIILDYGLTDNQKEVLSAEGVIIRPCIRDGHVTNLFPRDLATAALEGGYEQILRSDGGDIIFQADISKYWTVEPDYFRGTVEDINYGFENVFTGGMFEPELEKEILKVQKGKKTINIGILFGPAKEFARVGKATYENILDKNKFGPEQVYFNYALYKDNLYKPILDSRYNFVPLVAEKDISIRHGVIYTGGELVKVVHNAGNKNIMRVIRNFGYGPDHNRLKCFNYYLFRTVYKMMQFFHSRKNL